MTVASTTQLKRPIWQTIVILTLGLWLGGSLLLDWVIMPSLYVSGMMTQPGFISAGYLMFWNFNRIELFSAALVLTGILALGKSQSYHAHLAWKAAILSSLLLAIALINTYFLTPNMCAVGMPLNVFESIEAIPTAMSQLHAGYWMLEVAKFVVGGTLLSWCFRPPAQID
jgi:hypothetical protein